MDAWFVVVVTLCLCALLRPVLFRRSHLKTTNNHQLPPGPSALFSTLLLLTKSSSELEPILRNLKAKYGPLVTFSVGFRSSIFVGSHSAAHQVLIQNGAVVSDRPPRDPPIFNISSASYGPTWRLLRRNLASEIFQPYRVKSYSWARKWVLSILIGRLLKSQATAVRVVNHFQYAMFCLLVFMCFGDKLEEDRINEIETVMRRLLLGVGSGRFNVFSIWPRVGRIVFRNRWKELQGLRNDVEEVLIPLIEGRIGEDHSKTQSEGEERIVAYVDTLVNLQLPEEESRNGNGKLSLKDMVSICSEFLSAGTDTTSTALQWIMANLVKNPQIQEKLYREIAGVVGNPPPLPEQELESVVKEEDLEKMPYLKAVVLEGLRRHPPGHFVLPHRVTEDVELEGYIVPKGASMNFMVAEMGWDPNVWDDPMEFKPERFLFSLTGNGVDDVTASAAVAFDITGSKEIKMMPFGVGRRICPGASLALLHLEYFVANLIWYFQWTAADGDDVDLSEKQEFTVVMKNPLRAHIYSRAEQRTG